MTLEEKKESVPYVTHATKYLKFVIVRFSGERMVLAVANIKTGVELGLIQWIAKKRQFCFITHGGMVLSEKYLRDILLFMSYLNSLNKPKPKTIGVISKNLQDFQDWSKQKKHRKKSGTIRKYFRGINTYICLSDPNNCHGMMFDKILETDNAKLNSNYNVIKQSANQCLMISKI